MTTPIQHTLVSRSGETWTGQKVWTGEPKRAPWQYSEDYLLFLFEIDGQKVWLNNYDARLKCGEYKDGQGQWYYEVNDTAVRKIKKALESAANSTAKI